MPLNLGGRRASEKLNRVAGSDGTQEPARRPGELQPGPQRPYKRGQESHRRTRGGAAKWSTGARQFVPKWGLSVGCDTHLAPSLGRGRRRRHRVLGPDPAAHWRRERGMGVWRRGLVHCHPRPLGHCSFFEVLGTEQKGNKRFSTRPSSGEGVVRSPSPEEQDPEARLRDAACPGASRAWQGRTQAAPLSSESEVSVEVSVPRSWRKKLQRVLPNPETRHWTCQVKAEIKAVPVSNSTVRSICKPQDCSLRSASAEAGPEPWGTRAWAPSLWKNTRRVRSVCKGSTLQCSQQALTVHAPLPNRQHKERQYPYPLNNAGRDEHTF